MRCCYNKILASVTLCRLIICALALVKLAKDHIIVIATKICMWLCPAALAGVESSKERGIQALPGRGSRDGEVAQPADGGPQQVRLQHSIPLQHRSKSWLFCLTPHVCRCRPYANIADILAVNIGRLMLDVVPGRVRACFYSLLIPLL